MLSEGLKLTTISQSLHIMVPKTHAYKHLHYLYSHTFVNIQKTSVQGDTHKHPNIFSLHTKHKGNTLTHIQRERERDTHIHVHRAIRARSSLTAGR